MKVGDNRESGWPRKQIAIGMPTFAAENPSSEANDEIVLIMGWHSRYNLPAMEGKKTKEEKYAK